MWATMDQVRTVLMLVAALALITGGSVVVGAQNGGVGEQLRAPAIPCPNSAHASPPCLPPPHPPVECESDEVSGPLAVDCDDSDCVAENVWSGQGNCELVLVEPSAEGADDQWQGE